MAGTFAVDHDWIVTVSRSGGGNPYISLSPGKRVSICTSASGHLTLFANGREPAQAE